MNKITVMVIDKQTFFRKGVCQALSEQPEFEVSDCDPIQNPLGLMEANPPNVVLLDIDFPFLNGLELCRKIARRCPTVKIVMLTSDPTDGQLFEVIKTGAAAYLSKNATVEELAKIVGQVYRGEYPINDSLVARPEVAEQVLKQFQAMALLGKHAEAIAAPLTIRETQILSHIAEGNSNKQIGYILQISEQTIKNHVSSIMRKLNANDRAHAVVLAIRHGWISVEETPQLSSSSRSSRN